MPSQLKRYAGFLPFLNGSPLTSDRVGVRNAGLFELLDRINIFPAGKRAIAAIYRRLGEAEAGLFCPLKPAAA